MLSKRWISLLFSALALAVLSGCGGSGTTNLHNPPAPASSSVSITFQPAPATSVNLNSTTNFTAVVSNDPTNAGVDWALLCSSGGTSCGTLSVGVSGGTATHLHTASGTPTIYTPPATISGNSQTFTIEAFATADDSKNLVASIGVTGFAGNLKGTYVFQTRGVDANGVYQLAGVVTVDGNGGVTSGEQTHSDPLLSVTDAISGGSYSISPNGLGTLILNTADQNIGQLGIENLAFVFLSNAHALIQNFDNVNLQASSSETSTGTLDLQTSTAAPLHGYAFAVSGFDISLSPMAMGGILNIDSPKTISGAGSIADEDDASTGLSPNATVSGTVTNPDKYGSVIFTLTTSFSTTPVQFTGYIVDASNIRLVESDNNGSGTGFGITAGQATGQGAATGTFNNYASFAGNYVFSVLGEDFFGFPTSLASVGQFNADSAGNLTGYDDELASVIGTEIGDSFTGTYTPDATGEGRFDSNITFNTNGPGPELIFYLTGNGNPPLVLDADANLPAVGTGASYPQAAPPYSFNGKYGLYFTQSSFGSENDATGEILVSGTAMNFSGTVETEVGFGNQGQTNLTGTFSAIPNTGQFTGTLTNTLFPSLGASPNTLAVDFYLIDSGHGYFIETDSLTSGELTLGYFATRTPVCPNCQ